MFKRIKDKTKRKLLQINLLGIVLKNKLLRKENAAVKPIVWLDLSVDYERYSYILCKYFELEGYQVYIKANMKFLVKLTDPYSRRIVTEERIIFSSKKPAVVAAAFTDDQVANPNSKIISRDYFSTIFNKDPRSYHIPIGLHPNMYASGLWNAAITGVQRKRSVFFAGNFKESIYQEINDHKIFKMQSRLKIKKMLEELPNSTFPKSLKQLNENRKDGQIDIVTLSNFRLPQDLLRETIAGYAFFIACPGVVMPQSHNVYEAMSVGTIPIIHRQYAQMFDPELEHKKNAIIYKDDFVVKLQEALELNDELLNNMQAEVTKYYNRHLTPRAIVQQLLSSEKNRFFLNAEKQSVVLIR